MQLSGSEKITDAERSDLTRATIAEGVPAPKLFRGVNANASEKDFPVGRPFDLRASSASADEGSALPYAENGDGQPVLFEIEGARGLKVSGRAEATAGYAEEEWVTAGRFYVSDAQRDEDGVLVVTLARKPGVSPTAQKNALKPGASMDSFFAKPAASAPSGGVSKVDGPEAAKLAATVTGTDERSEFTRNALEAIADFGGNARVLVDRGPNGEVRGAAGLVEQTHDPADFDVEGPEKRYLKLDYLGSLESGAGSRLFDSVLQEVLDGDYDGVMLEGTKNSNDYWVNKQKLSVDPLDIGADMYGLNADEIRVRLGANEPSAPGVPSANSAADLDPVAKTLKPVPASVPEVTKVLAPTHVSEPELKSKPVPASVRRIPMEFKETPVSSVPAYAEDGNYFFQQKVDGIRGQLVLDPGKKPWFRSKSGDQLQSSTAAKISGPLLAKLGAGLPEGSPPVTVDGEMLDGKWYVFDMTVGDQGLPWEKRMAMAEEWVAQLRKQGVTSIESLPTARTPEEKKALFEAIRAGGGEGIMIKRKNAKYKWGQRTDEILKAKITASADVVVIERNRGGKDNAVVGVYKNGKLTEVGSVSTIGKEKTGGISVGDVLEVEYLWAHDGTGKLTQPRIKKPRPDKNPLLATDSQFRFVNKEVVDIPPPLA